MEALKEFAKVLQLGTKATYNTLRVVASEIAKVVSYHRKKKYRIDFKPSHPFGKPLGKVTYQVKSRENPEMSLTFKLLKDAKQFQKILMSSQTHAESDILRCEQDENGYIVQ
jgi:hypothetical protein